MYKIDGSELYEYQQQLLQPPEDIPIWEKKCLTVEEAAAYSGIGERKLKALLMDKDQFQNCKKRQAFNYTGEVREVY